MEDSGEDAEIKCPSCSSDQFRKVTSLSVLSVICVILATGSLAELIFCFVNKAPGWPKWLVLTGLWALLAFGVLNRKHAQCLNCKAVFKRKK
jgi:hypothetical protein